MRRETLCGLVLLAWSAAASAAPPKILHNFTGGADGALPFAPLIADKDGNFFGTTWAGATTAPTCEQLGCGTIFRLAPDGTLTTLHAFSGGADGANPTAALLRDSAGNFFGTTQRGGPQNFGTVFELDTTGHLTILHAFVGGPADGATPEAPLIADRNGALYGTTNAGGPAGNGTVFRLTESHGAWTLAVLHAFATAHDGAHPAYGALAQDQAGNLYGTTSAGGPSGQGTLFKLTPNGKATILHAFAGPDGATPLDGLLSDRFGNFYGTTFDPGTVFKLAQNGTLTTLHHFDSANNGRFPESSLVADAGGTLLGTTAGGGTTGAGSVFAITPSGHATTLCSLPADQAQPVGGLLFSAGSFYGTTLTGGPAHLGSIFRFVP
jgi:uncharacterized repeat protein (TIGR03803 family)